jgi:hypothetical protein
MDRVVVALVALCLLGIALLATAPAEPSYSMSLREAPDATPAEVTAFAALDTESQLAFLTLLQDGNWRDSEPPPLENSFVRYKSDLYRVYVSVSESSVFSLLQPVVGGGMAVLAAGAVVLRRLWRRDAG